MAGRIPGPLCAAKLPPDWIDDGTSALWRMPSPGPLGAAAEISGEPGLLDLGSASDFMLPMLAAATETTASAEPVPELSGAQWVARFPTSTSLDDLDEPFRTGVRQFIAALTAAGASVRIGATYRPPERAFLMHYASRVASGKLAASAVPSRAGININWVHPTNAQSVAAAQAMVNGYGIVFPPALASNHSGRKAIDMTITNFIGKTIVDADGDAVKLLSAAELHAAGATFGVKKLASDPPHWSHDGH